MNTSYDRTKFDRLTKLMEFNVKNNTKVIMDTIKRTIEVKILIWQTACFKDKVTFSVLFVSVYRSLCLSFCLS